MNTNGKAGKALKQANWETKGELEVSYFARESTQVTPVTQKGNSRANAFYNTQIAALQTTEMVNPAQQLKVSEMGICRTRPNGTYFKPNNGRLAPLGISKGT